MRTMNLEAYSYAASKAAVNHLTRLMAKFPAPRHIAVNGIAPGYFPSKMTAGLGEVGLSEVAEAADRQPGRHRKYRTLPRVPVYHENGHVGSGPLYASREDFMAAVKWIVKARASLGSLIR